MFLTDTIIHYLRSYIEEENYFKGIKNSNLDDITKCELYDYSKSHMQYYLEMLLEALKKQYKEELCL